MGILVNNSKSVFWLPEHTADNFFGLLHVIFSGDTTVCEGKKKLNT